MDSPRPDKTWRVDAAAEFTAWLKDLDPQSQEKVVALRRLLERHGPTLGRPYADRIKGSTRQNLKELRPSSSQEEALRVLFYFDPERTALLLVGGNKATDWSGWYDTNIPIAESRIARHESELKRRAAERIEAAGQLRPGITRQATRKRNR
jgi:hypothetical protein